MHLSTGHTRISGRFSRAAAALILLAALMLGLGVRETAEAQTSVTLYRPWSLVAVTESGPVAEVFGGIYTDAVFAWEAAGEEFDSWRKSLPAGLNSLQRVTAGQAVWVLASLQDRFLQAALEQAIDVALLAGWNLVGWTGVETAAATVAGVLGADIVIAYDGPGQVFARFDAGLPAAFNSLQTVAQGAGLWAYRASAGTVTLPAGGGASPQPEPQPEPATSQEVRLVAADGVNLAAAEFFGSATWLLFAHQNGRDRSAWGDLPADTLGMAGFSALAWDFRGFGGSDPGALSDIALDWQAAIDYAVSRGAQIILGVGASMGGTSGLVVAAADPRLNSLILISSPANFAGIDALAAASNVFQPLFFVAGDQDGTATADAQAMFEAAPGNFNQILILETALHGNDLINSPDFDNSVIFGP